MTLPPNLVGKVGSEVVFSEGQERTNVIDFCPDSVVLDPVQKISSCTKCELKCLLNNTNPFHSFNIRNLECNFIGFFLLRNGKKSRFFLMPVQEVVILKSGASLEQLKLLAKIPLKT